MRSSTEPDVVADGTGMHFGPYEAMVSVKENVRRRAGKSASDSTPGMWEKGEKP